MRITTIDYHTAGEPLRIVTSGLPDIPGNSMVAKRRFMHDEMDTLRKFLMLEPRGHADMYGAVLTRPVTADGDTGVLFMHNAGFSTMCGHGIIALVTAAVEHGLFSIRDPQAIRIDTPAGRITARVNQAASGDIDSVSFLNVPSFVLEESCNVSVDGQKIVATVAFGGAFYAYVDAGQFGFDLKPFESGRLIDLGQKIKYAVSQKLKIRHPTGHEDLNFLYGTIFTGQSQTPGHSRNVCIFAEGELDRSPTGTGVSGRAAIEFARGSLALDQQLSIESIIGTRFQVRCVEETTVGDFTAVIPEVTGSAYISGEHRFVLSQRDSLSEGFFIPR